MVSGMGPRLGPTGSSSHVRDPPCGEFGYRPNPSGTRPDLYGSEWRTPGDPGVFDSPSETLGRTFWPVFMGVRVPRVSPSRDPIVLWILTSVNPGGGRSVDGRTGCRLHMTTRTVRPVGTRSVTPSVPFRTHSSSESSLTAQSPCIRDHNDQEI